MDKLVVGWNAVEGMSQLAVYRGVECPLSTVVVCCRPGGILWL